MDGHQEEEPVEVGSCSALLLACFASVLLPAVLIAAANTNTIFIWGKDCTRWSWRRHGWLVHGRGARPSL
jgi:hypothetical protein